MENKMICVYCGAPATMYSAWDNGHPVCKLCFHKEEQEYIDQLDEFFPGTREAHADWMRDLDLAIKREALKK
jgi:thymidine kinase